RRYLRVSLPPARRGRVGTPRAGAEGRPAPLERAAGPRERANARTSLPLWTAVARRPSGRPRSAHRRPGSVHAARPGARSLRVPRHAAGHDPALAGPRPPANGALVPPAGTLDRVRQPRRRAEPGGPGARPAGLSRTSPTARAFRPAHRRGRVISCARTR